MIIEAFVNIAYGMVDFILSIVQPFVITDGGDFANFFSVAAKLIQSASIFLPMDIIVLVLGNILIWFSVHFLISLLRFILDLLPLF